VETLETLESVPEGEALTGGLLLGVPGLEGLGTIDGTGTSFNDIHDSRGPMVPGGRSQSGLPNAPILEALTHVCTRERKRGNSGYETAYGSWLVGYGGQTRDQGGTKQAGVNSVQGEYAQVSVNPYANPRGQIFCLTNA